MKRNTRAAWLRPRLWLASRNAARVRRLRDMQRGRTHPTPSLIVRPTHLYLELNTHALIP